MLNANWDRLDYIYTRRMLMIMLKLCHDNNPDDFKQLFDDSCRRYARHNSLVVVLKHFLNFGPFLACKPIRFMYKNLLDRLKKL